MPMSQLFSSAIAARRFNMLLLAAFAALAALLAATGIYGVISYSVAERTREIGIRLVPGAQASDLLKLVAGHGMKLVLIGMALGLGASFVLTRLIESLLFSVSPTDPVTFAVIALLLAGVGMLACWIPARRAAKVDPIIALREQ
jgi:putative ABC transport system permease protein